MNSKILLFLLALSFFITPAFSQTQPLISISTSSNSYEAGETIVIAGEVATVILDTPVTISIFQELKLIQIAQLQVAQDGTFTHTIIAEGPQWKNEGEYVIRAQYGEGNVAEVSFQFFKKYSSQDTSNTFEVDAGSSGTFDVEYTIRGGIIKDMIVDSDIFALIVIIDSGGDGSITLDLPRSSIEAKKSDGSDDIFIILIDGIEVPYQESQTSDNTRTITVEFEEGDSDIEIIGTFIIPEFGTITSLILVLSIISMIIVSTNRKLLAKI